MCTQTGELDFQTMNCKATWAELKEAYERQVLGGKKNLEEPAQQYPPPLVVEVPERLQAVIDSPELLQDIKNMMMKLYWDGYYFRELQDQGSSNITNMEE